VSVSKGVSKGVLQFPTSNRLSNQSEQKVYIGIDPSLTATAVIAIDAAGKFVKGTVCKVDKTGPARLARIRNQVRTFIEMLSGPGGDQVGLIGIEHYAMGAKFGREAAGELGGVLRVAMYEDGQKYVEIPPLQLKQFATGKGVAQKDHVLMAVYKKWGMEFKTNDEADAFVAAQVARAVDMAGRGENVKLTAYEAAVVGKILNPVKKSKKKEAS
jgi:crossover junction endodeoxyribonuclease RuvC